VITHKTWKILGDENKTQQQACDILDKLSHKNR